MIQKENQRIALTRRLLQEGLLNLLETKSIDKVSVTELCRVSGINRSTFYNHYTSPQDILNDMERTVIKELLEIASKYYSKPSSLECFVEICTYLSEHKHVSTALITFNSDTDLVEVFRCLERHYDSQRIQKARATDPDKVHLISTFFCTGCYYMIREWLIRDLKKTPREIAELAYAFVSNAEAVPV